MLSAKEALRRSKQNSQKSELDLLLHEVDSAVRAAVDDGEQETTVSVFESFSGYEKQLLSVLKKAGYKVTFNKDYDTCHSRWVIHLKWGKERWEQ